jgi:hypothetical protein
MSSYIWSIYDPISKGFTRDRPKFIIDSIYGHLEFGTFFGKSALMHYT